MESEREADQALLRLLAVAWKRIAGAGWNRYQLHGRGALLASMDMLEGKAGSGEMDYMTPSGSVPLPEWLQSAVSSYDPRTSVVLVFVEAEAFRRAMRRVAPDDGEGYEGTLSGPAYFRVVTHTPTPPECARDFAN